MQRYDKSPTWANKKHAEETQHVFFFIDIDAHRETLFQFQNILATLFLAIFKIIWPSRHPFCPFSKSFGLRDTLFSRFQNRLALATLFSPVFKTD
ncbi:MAG: hypothetical protein IKJ78_07860 [Bacteroidales bacterium]|nr:hypothetical protein [Bacteroidales bacterium]